MRHPGWGEYLPPDWYFLLVAARVLNVPVGPWPTADKIPRLWVERALMAHRAESDANSFHTAQQLKGMFPS